MNNRISTKKIALCGVLTALAMIFSYIESVIPIPIPVPGIKLGVANIAVITILYVLGVKEAIVINLLRIALTALLFGNVNSFFVQYIRCGVKSYNYDNYEKARFLFVHRRERMRRCYA